MVTYINGFPFIPYRQRNISSTQMVKRSASFYKWIGTRRSVREFSDRHVPLTVVRNIIRAAATAPSGANKQPWTFCIVSSPELKKAIRVAAEKEEYANYHGRMSQAWLDDLRPLQTGWDKPFLEKAPHLIVLFKRILEHGEGGARRTNYYVSESIGIATGMLITAIHHAGLGALVHTPSPMNFLAKILKRPDNERAHLLIPVGYPADGALVPRIKRKRLQELCVTY